MIFLNYLLAHSLSFSTLYLKWTGQKVTKAGAKSSESITSDNLVANNLLVKISANSSEISNMISIVTE